MDEPLPESSIPIEFYKKNNRLYILVSGLEAMMDNIIKNADEMDLEAMKEMREIILQLLDKGKVTGLTDFS